MRAVIVHLEQIRFRYPDERFELRIPSFAIGAAESIAVVGPSGCGKTTLLRLVSGILRPEAGRIRVLGEDLESLGETEMRAFRIRNIGLVFQDFELIDYLNAAENILLPFRVASGLGPARAARGTVGQLAAATGIEHLLGAYPAELSQGERQRVAICRALINRPRLVLADEPTGSLDPANRDRVAGLLRERSADFGACLILVTHDLEMTGRFERVIRLPDLIDSGK